MDRAIERRIKAARFPVLKTLEDGRRIKKHLAQNTVRHVVIVGMGYVALEMAESLEPLYGVAARYCKVVNGV